MNRDKKSISALIVEDVESDALLLIDNLETGGYKVDWCRVDTEKAMQSALQQDWDIVFSDFSMPTFSGDRALRVLRDHDLDVPLIFVSGTIGEDVAVQAMKCGAQDYVMKGNLSRLAVTVERELRDARMRRERRQSEDTLRKLSMVVSQAADSVFITDPKGRIEYINPAFIKLTGYTESEAMGKTPALFRSSHHDATCYKQLWETILSGNMYQGVLVNQHKGGKLFHEEKIITALKDETGTVTHFVSTGRDITERVHAEEARARFASILEATPDLVAILEADGQLLHLNCSGRKLLGLSLIEDVTNYALGAIFPEKIRQQLASEIIPEVMRVGSWSGESLLTVMDKHEMPVSLVVLAHNDVNGELEYLSTIARDISERKLFEEELRHQATHDSLTSLPNRFFLRDRFDTMLGHARRHQNCIAVLFMDLDNFKRVNDSLGHEAGDCLLKQVANRLMNTLRPNDTIARLGGDEFAIIIGDLARSETALIILTKLRAAFERPIIIGVHEVYVTFSTGISLFPHDGEHVKDLLRHADTAMYQAKASGSDQYRFYAPDMNARGHELLRLEADLQHALEHDEFRLYYQPQISLKTGKVVGAEALIRWQHASRGLVSPLDFIPLLENSGLIIYVGEWVLRAACRQYQHWMSYGCDDFRISVNVSACQFTDKDFLSKVRRIIEEENMPANRLELEITENVVMQNPDHATDILRTLNALGVRTVIDDFGTGYSSLAYLKRFPLNVLKIDRTFISELDDNSSDAAIVDASIHLAQKFNLEVVAEGVETEGQLEYLQKHHCDMVQGFFFSKPLPHVEFLAFIKDYNERKL